MKAIAIDFDGVIHRYSKGWQDGSIYDPVIPGAFEAIQSFIQQGYSVFIFSTRSPRQIKRWMIENCYDSEYIAEGMGGDPNLFIYPKYGFTVKRIPFWKKFWNEKGVVGITRRKIAAHVYIDDRALNFKGDWNETIQQAMAFKPYQQTK